MAKATQTQKRDLKNQYIEEIGSILEQHGFTCERTVKGWAIFDEPSNLYIVVDAIVKNEDYDIDDAVMELEDRLNKAEERAKKAADKAAKEQAKKDKATE